MESHHIRSSFVVSEHHLPRHEHVYCRSARDIWPTCAAPRLEVPLLLLVTRQGRQKKENKKPMMISIELCKSQQVYAKKIRLWGAVRGRCFKFIYFSGKDAMLQTVKPFFSSSATFRSSFTRFLLLLFVCGCAGCRCAASFRWWISN